MARAEVYVPYPSVGLSAPMIQNLTIEVNSQQRDLLLQGLRYIRSSRRLEFRDPLAPPDEKREGELKEIAGLMTQLEGKSAAVPASV